MHGSRRNSTVASTVRGDARSDRGASPLTVWNLKNTNMGTPVSWEPCTAHARFWCMRRWGHAHKRVNPSTEHKRVYSLDISLHLCLPIVLQGSVLRGGQGPPTTDVVHFSEHVEVATPGLGVALVQDVHEATSSLHHRETSVLVISCSAQPSKSAICTT